jgi:hypothetical protein
MKIRAHSCPVNAKYSLVRFASSRQARPKGLAGRASYPQRRCVFLLNCDSAAASVSAVAVFNVKGPAG